MRINLPMHVLNSCALSVQTRDHSFVSSSPRLSDHLPISLSRSRPARDFPPPLSPSLSQNGIWKGIAQQQLVRLLACANSLEDKIRALEKSGRNASLEVARAEWLLPRDDHELNLYFAQVAYGRLLRGSVQGAYEIVARAPHWSVKRAPHGQCVACQVG